MAEAAAKNSGLREALVLAALRGGHDLAAILPFVAEAEIFVLGGDAAPAAAAIAAPAQSARPAAGPGRREPDPAGLRPYLREALAVLRAAEDGGEVTLEEMAATLRAKPGSVKAYHSDLRKRGFVLRSLPAAAKPAPVKKPAAAPRPAAPREVDVVALPPGDALAQGVADPAAAAKAAAPARDFLAGLSNRDAQIVSLRRRGWNAAQLAGRFSMAIPEINALLRRLEREGHLPADAETGGAA